MSLWSPKQHITVDKGQKKLDSGSNSTTYQLYDFRQITTYPFLRVLIYKIMAN